MRKVIFIAGTGRSGSTLLDLMLGNGPGCFSAGEMYALFWPRRPHHLLSSGCICGDPECNFWSSLREDGEEIVYKKLFAKLGVDVVVDSIKHPLWLEGQVGYGRKSEYSLIPVVIYKSPVEFAYSLDKRGDFSQWRTMWVRRHRWLFNVLDDFVSVKYRNLAKSPSELLQDLCREIGIEYFSGKKEFWKADTRHFLFGSGSVKKSDHTVYYEDQFEEERLSRVREKIDIDHTVKQIQSVLEGRSVWGASDNNGRIDALQDELAGVNPLLYVYRKCKSTRWYLVNRIFEGIV